MDGLEGCRRRNLNSEGHGEQDSQVSCPEGLPPGDLDTELRDRPRRLLGYHWSEMAASIGEEDEAGEKETKGGGGERKKRKKNPKNPKKKKKPSSKGLSEW